MGNQYNVLRNRINLCHVSRWTIVPMTRHDSVAEHSYRVAAIAEFIADRLEPHILKVDRLHLLHLALAHDIEEVLSGDIPTPAKIHINKIAIKAAVDGVFEDPGSPESAIVKAADFIDTILSLRLFGVSPFKESLVKKIECRFKDWMNENATNCGLNVFSFTEAIDEAKALLFSDLIVPNWMEE